MPTETTTYTNKPLLVLSGLLPWAVLLAGCQSSGENQLWSLLSLCALSTLSTIGLFIWTRTETGQKVAEALGPLLGFFALTVSATFSVCILLIGGAMDEELFTKALVVLLSILVWILGDMSVRAPRNRLLGFRTQRTLRDDNSWIQANQVYGGWMKVASPLSLFGLVSGRFGPLVAILPAVLIGIAFLIDDFRLRSRFRP